MKISSFRACLKSPKLFYAKQLTLNCWVIALSKIPHNKLTLFFHFSSLWLALLIKFTNDWGSALKTDHFRTKTKLIYNNDLLLTLTIEFHHKRLIFSTTDWGSPDMRCYWVTSPYKRTDSCWQKLVMNGAMKGWRLSMIFTALFIRFTLSKEKLCHIWRLCLRNWSETWMLS